MKKIKLKKFLPLNSPASINKLLEYLQTNPNKFSLEICLLNIHYFSIARYFLSEGLKRKIWPEKESLITLLYEQIKDEENFEFCKEKLQSKSKSKSQENQNEAALMSKPTEKSVKLKVPLFSPKQKDAANERKQIVIEGDNLNKNDDQLPPKGSEASSSKPYWKGSWAHMRAMDLTVKKGIIYFGGNWLLSSHIPETSREVLRLIDHEFYLKRNPNPYSKTFVFVPIRDFDFLLTEIDRITCRLNCERNQSIQPLSIQENYLDIPSTNAPVENSIKPSWDGVNARVLAKDLKISKGMIYFQGYWLNSPELIETSPEILKLIDHEFCLKRDLNSKFKKFTFEPTDDLSYLLAEIERLSFPSNNILMDMYPSSGTFSLPWRYVIFYDGIIYFEHPNPSKRGTSSPFFIKHSSILKAYRYILPYIKEKMPMFKVEAKDGVIISVLNFKSFEDIVLQVRQHSFKFPKGMDILDGKGEFYGTSYTKEEFARRITKDKSPYINLLSKRQLSDKRIYYLLEVGSHTINSTEEYGYLFTIRERNGITTLIFENITDESRSSIVFSTHSKNYNAAIIEIQNFLGSKKENKRQLLASKRLNLNDKSNLISISRIIHIDYDSWLSNFNKLFF